MKIFDEPNLSGDWVCPICGTNENKEVTLIGIDGTGKGNNMQAIQVHMDCIELTFYKSFGCEASRAIAMFFDEVKA